MSYLKRLTYRNFLLFETLDFLPEKGLNIITGESGAGKSLFLEGLVLLTGGRLDGKLVAGLSEKAILEAVFYTKNNHTVNEFLAENDLDIEPELLIRREILTSGKNRCFVNDTPVNLQVLKDLGEKLCEIHSQHETTFIKSNSYQIDLLDNYAQTLDLREEFCTILLEIRKAEKKLADLQNTQANAIKEQDYLSYLADELNEAGLHDIDEETDLEEEQILLANSSEIVSLSEAVAYGIEGGEQSLENFVSEIRAHLKNLVQISSLFEEEFKRFESAWIELKETAKDVEQKGNRVSIDPQRLQEVEDRLVLFQQLKRKHNAGSLEELIAIKESLAQNMQGFDSLEAEIEKCKKQLSESEKQLIHLAHKLSEKRREKAGELSERVVKTLTELEIPSAVFKINTESMERENWTVNGADKISFLFSANAGIEPQNVESVASGGELSRLMLSFKAVSGGNQYLTVFDEIDTGVSGETAVKVGGLIHQMSKHSQLLVITHLPQVASRGGGHFVIRKETTDKKSGSEVLKLRGKERVLEIARLLSGKNPGEKAIKNAEELLENES